MIPSFSRYPLFYLFILLVGATGCNYLKSEETKTKVDLVISTATQKQIDTIDYNKRMLQLSNHDSTGKWPVKTPYPLTGAIFPITGSWPITEIYFQKNGNSWRNT